MNTNFTVEQLIVGQLQANCYLYCDTKAKELVIIDPGDDAGYIIDHIAKSGAQPKAIIATHGHFDHLLAAFELQETYQIPCYLHKNDAFLLPQMRKTASHFIGINEGFPPPPRSVTYVAGGHTFSFGEMQLRCISTAGHTPGSISLYHEKHAVLFSGDTLFAGGLVGDCSHQYADKEQMNASLERLFLLPEDTLVYSGHGEQTTIGEEKNFHQKKNGRFI